MASYVLAKSTTSISYSGATYSTITDLLTVPSGHIYLIKGIDLIADVNATGAGAQYFNLGLTNTSGTQPNQVTQVVHLTNAATVNAYIYINFTPPLVAGYSAVTAPSSVAVVADAVYSFNVHSTLKDKHLAAGQVLRFSPRLIYASATGSTAATALGSVVRIEISYIDYTI